MDAGDAPLRPRSLFRDHVGSAFLVAAAAALAVAFARRARPGPRVDRVEAGFLLLAFAVPLAALTVDTDKSPVVGSVLVPPLLWMILLPALRGTGPRWLGRTAAIGLLLLGVTRWGYRLLSPAQGARSHEELAEVNSLLEAATSAVVDHARQRPVVVSCDRTSDFFTHSVLRVHACERHGVLLTTVPGLFQSLLAVTPHDATACVAASDLVLLTLSERDPPPPIPFEASMRDVRPALLALCRRDRPVLGQFVVHGAHLVLFGPRGGAGLVQGGLQPPRR